MRNSRLYSNAFALVTEKFPFHVHGSRLRSKEIPVFKSFSMGPDARVYLGLTPGRDDDGGDDRIGDSHDH